MRCHLDTFFGRLAARPLAPGRGALLWLVLALGAGCASETREAPDLLPLSASTARVNEIFRLDLAVNNPSGAALDFSFVGPDLPGLAEVISIAGTSAGGEFRWTPLASHVGNHELTFTITSSFGSDTESVLITVTPAASAAPVFLRPGAGGTYDLSRDPCVRFDVEVRDDDSQQVVIRFRGDAVAGARLCQTGPRQAEVEWCPSPEQTDLSDRWTFALEADDGDHAPTPHDYLVVLRTAARDNCEGDPPVVTVRSPGEGERVTSASGYRVRIEILDDVGVREAPLLYYSTVEPEYVDDPDITEFDQATFSLAGTLWEATVPPLGLEPGSERRVYFLASVTDNDDPNGTTCDHRTDTFVHQFVAVGAEPTERAAACELCTGSVGCQSGICEASGGGTGVCLPGCVPGDDCGTGACVGTLTVEGSTVEACGDHVAYCDGGGEACVDDDFEPDPIDNPRPIPAHGNFEGVICPGDADHHAFTIVTPTRLQALIVFSHVEADLDLYLYDPLGREADSSVGTDDDEELDVDLADPGTYVLRVEVYGEGSTGYLGQILLEEL